MTTYQNILRKRDLTVAGEVDYGGYRTIIPHITGSAFVTGMHNFVIDPEDPFQTGFILR